jgi:hypothetical protein
MGKFIAAMDDLKAQFPGCVIVIIHHSGHADKQRARGAMALKAALDFEYRVEKSDAMIRLTNTKMKDAAPPAPIAFELETVQLGDGASSAVLIQCDGAESVKPLTANQKLALRAFWEAAAHSGQFDDDGEFLGLALEPWREVFYRMHTGDNSEAKRKAFQRARKDLVNAGRLAVADDIYRPCGFADKLAISHGRKKFANGAAGQAGQTGTMSRHVPGQKRDTRDTRL